MKKEEKNKKIEVELEKSELDYLNNFLFSHRCEIELLSEVEKKRKPIKDDIRIINQLEKKLSL